MAHRGDGLVFGKKQRAETWSHPLPRSAPGSTGPAFRDKTYLTLTADLFAAVLDQVHAALERGIFKLDDVQAAVNVDAIGQRYTPGAATPGDDFHDLVTSLVGCFAGDARSLTIASSGPACRFPPGLSRSRAW